MSVTIHDKMRADDKDVTCMEAIGERTREREESGTFYLTCSSSSKLTLFSLRTERATYSR